LITELDQVPCRSAIENLQALEDDGEPKKENIEEIWPDYPTKDDFLNER
jgi:hypothetical protein